MAHAETCPLCHGKGMVQEHGSTAVDGKVCHGCNGQGWVSVDDKSYFGDPPMHYWPEYPNFTSSRFHNIDYVLVQ